MENLSKQHTFHALKDYTAIGFDVDHTLVRYNLPDFFPITYECLARSLVNDKKYPDSLLEYGKQEQSFLHNGLIIDIKSGIIMKLGESKIILRAYLGFTRIKDKELEHQFGNPPVYEIFDPHKTRTPEYIACITYYELALLVLYAKITELRKNEGRELNEDLFQEILMDCFYALKCNYAHFDEKKYYSIANFGYFFKGLTKNIEKAVPKMSKMLQYLKKLKNKGKVLFLVSNSHYEHVKVVMDHAYGSGWEKIFDYIIPKAGKPFFFTIPDRVFRAIDHSSISKIGNCCTELRQHVFYTDGNSKILEDNIKRLKGKSGRILFFGDNFSTDALAAQANPNWDSVCIMEDLGSPSYGYEFDAEVWGSFCEDETIYGKIPSFWHSFMHGNVAKIVKSVDCQELLKYYEE